jgi:hypothetical protein
MRVIFLNSWYGKVGDKYFEFIENQASKTEIFCLQEITPDLFPKLEKLLPDHKGLFLTENIVEVLGFVYGKAVFVNKKFNLKGFGILSAYKTTPKDCGFSQPFDVRGNGPTLHINSIHGKTFPADKLDSPTRLKQSKVLIDYFKNKVGPKIIGGDFNLNPDTKSIKMFEEEGYTDLIKKFKIATTRNHLAWEQAEFQLVKQGFKYFGKQYFADYAFVSPEIKVKSFEVPYLEISDHLPLILDFDFSNNQY